MKLIHLSDLHLGKRVNEFSMLPDQEYILLQIINKIDEVKPDGVIIAGDVYDKSVPPAEAVQLFDRFLTMLMKRQLFVLVISGNHDSPERIAFGSQLMRHSGVYMAPVFSGQIEPIVKTDADGEVVFYLLPFVKPAHVRRFFPEAEINSYQDALKVLTESLEVDFKKRNVVVAHQFITGAERSDSEEISVGGMDNVDASIFEAFDYIALGHIHRPQYIKMDKLRYSGSPLKYSFSEAAHKKSVTVVDLGAKGAVSITTLPLVPQYDLREIKGTYDEVTARSFYQNSNINDYLHITLTDEEDIPEAVGKLRVIYPNLMKLDYDNKRTRENQTITGVDEMTEKSPLQHVMDFYEKQNNQEMSPEQEAFTAQLFEKILEGQR